MISAAYRPLRNPWVGDLAVNADGSVAITGVTSLGLGVIDLVAETSARLWEGAGLEGL